MRKNKLYIVLLAALVVLLFGSFSVAFARGEGEKEKPEGPITLRFLYAQWDPGNALAKTAVKYEEVTGGMVKVEADLKAPDLWYQQWLATAQAHEYVWDIVVVDSQWLGMAVDGGHVVELTELIGNKPFVKEIPPTMKKYYMADPTDSGKIWSVPLEADTECLFYRTDLFGDPANKRAFKAKYGYELEVPETWHKLRDMAEFFHDPANEFYGFCTKWGKTYDVITWDFNQVLWGFGGAYWDRKTKTAEGYINSPTAIEAMEFYKSLTNYAPPGWPEADWSITIDLMNQGQLAMIIEWSSFAPSVFSPEDSKVHDRVASAVSPAGPKEHWVSLGGQPMTISAYSPYQQEAADFIEWFYQPEQLWVYAENRGHPAYESIMKSQRFWDLLPQNKTLWESVPYVRDIWNIPVYNELLAASQELLNDAATGAKPIKAALDELAARNQKALDAFYK
jgi:multiple sugar transport system substrate-binding protein